MTRIPYGRRRTVSKTILSLHITFTTGETVRSVPYGIIIDDLDASSVFEFPCERWFALDEDDGKITRELILNLGPRDMPAGEL
ncbi:lipoxygenase homology domain-containing protein 1 [Elysia marginata]|uniref:Lipoxygenase homology domain-containing protein 1 n=1 Tax=Elysia marginata TaxID=1093978 RepID=A0AAV4FYP2_9GAST|nr:lipoxygenase homology domain-containing protein 1 [Elysia marginata]